MTCSTNNNENNQNNQNENQVVVEEIYHDDNEPCGVEEEPESEEPYQIFDSETGEELGLIPLTGEVLEFDEETEEYGDCVGHAQCGSAVGNTEPFGWEWRWNEEYSDMKEYWEVFRGEEE